MQEQDIKEAELEQFLRNPMRNPIVANLFLIPEAQILLIQELLLLAL